MRDPQPVREYGKFNQRLLTASENILLPKTRYKEDRERERLRLAFISLKNRYEVNFKGLYSGFTGARAPLSKGIEIIAEYKIVKSHYRFNHITNQTIQMCYADVFARNVYH